jgi:hypothetical protein
MWLARASDTRKFRANTPVTVHGMIRARAVPQSIEVK